jgi:transcription elongation GreA/GreB family factor
MDGGSEVVVIRHDDPELWAEKPETWIKDSISGNSPIGAALLGRQVGEEVEVFLHASIPVRRVTIEAVE